MFIKRSEAPILQIIETKEVDESKVKKALKKADSDLLEKTTIKIDEKLVS